MHDEPLGIMPLDRQAARGPTRHILKILDGL